MSIETIETYRLVTRSDFDGLVCAVLLKRLGILDDIKFVHPKDMQDGKVALGQRDITTNLPYVQGVHLAFDHHLSETSASARPRQPRHRPRRRLGRARGLPPLRRAGALPDMPRGDDGGRRQGRRAQFSRRRDPRPDGLGAPQLPHGRPHRARPLPRVPHLELRPDDGPDRRLPRHTVDEILALPDVEGARRHLLRARGRG